VTGRPRRDFLLDSGGVSALAANRDLLVAYLELLKLRLTGALLIPIPVLTEVRSGQRRSDALVDRLIKAIGAEDDVYAPLTAHTAARAGVLRAEASRRSRHSISTTDAQIVAMAEERSYTCAVTIVTGDPDDINLLVGLTLRTNIAVDVLG
jgi:predicted nucleic acid-binding protein